MFGTLWSRQRQRGRDTIVHVEVPQDGMSARHIAQSLELPLEEIEGVFCNRTIRPLDYLIEPGDRIAFVASGTPGPHRYFLGIYDAGKGVDRR